MTKLRIAIDCLVTKATIANRMATRSKP